ncbi:MAG TPA: hypothetical protein VMS17_23345 [Gemmataceae bacterium]|nr:hypothetical protein [Gemmataceae bacterium]
MLRKILCIALVAAATLMTSAKAQAWGAYHVGYTHVGPEGVQHYGRTGASGPYGSYGGSHYGAYGYGGGSYHSGSAYGDRYGGSYGGAYHYGSYGSYGSYDRYGGYRGW